MRGWAGTMKYETFAAGAGLFIGEVLADGECGSVAASDGERDRAAFELHSGAGCVRFCARG